MHQGHLFFLQIYAEVMLQVPAFLEKEIRATSVLHIRDWPNAIQEVKYYEFS